MVNIYDLMLQALRGHWGAHGNAYPQRFELQAASLESLNALRLTVIQTMNYKELPGWRETFMGVAIAPSADVDCMVNAAGERVPLVPASV